MPYGRAYREIVLQASMLSYKDAFLILSMSILCLSPLPFIMRRPPRVMKPAPDAAH